MPANLRETNSGIDNTHLLKNQEITIHDEESPITMFRRRKNEEENEENNSKAQNDRPKPKSPTWKGGQHAKSIVYGGLDAIVTCFSLISSISSGGTMSSVDVLVLGFANLVADGISMGFGDYVSSSTENKMVELEKDVTEWEVDHNGVSEMRNLVGRYRDLGMDPHDAATVVKIFSKYKNIMVEEEMMGQKGMPPVSHQDDDKPWKSGLVTFTSFILFGSAPLLSFIILIPFTDNDNIKFVGACILSALALALLGLAKAKISGEGYGLSALTTLFNGVVAAATAYAISWTLRNVAGLEEP